MLGVTDQNISLHSDLYTCINTSFTEMKTIYLDKINKLKKDFDKDKDKKLKEIDELKGKYKADIQKYRNLIRTIPKLLRKNGLILTLSYLSKKSDAKQYEYISNHMIKYLNKNDFLSNKNFNELNNKKLSNQYMELAKIFLNNNNTEVTETDTRFFNKLRNVTLALLRFFDIYILILEGIVACEEELDG